MTKIINLGTTAFYELQEATNKRRNSKDLLKSNRRQVL